jgi:nucleotide-binding universal stress UspA family protein
MKLLLPVDGSAAALQAVKHAMDLVHGGLKAEFVLLNVQPPANLYEVMTAHDPDVIREVRSSAGADLLGPAEATLAGAGLSFESEVVGGDPGHAIVEAAERYGCDGIVMGARGMGDLRAAVLGSVSHAVLQACRRPVTIVRLPLSAD